ncbi:MAG: CPBP family intramembrane metalloprotease [Ruminococcus sp.]|nr:CPBP family intramembrane metalloprotease [Ruminococcus sp.]
MKIDCKMFEESSKSKAPKNIFAITALFACVFFISTFAESVIPTTIMLPRLAEKLQQAGYTGKIKFSVKYVEDTMNFSKEIMSNPKYFAAILICNIFMILISILFCKLIEKRSLKSMGFGKEKAFGHYFSGLFIGMFMMSANVFLSVGLGVNSINLSENINYGMLSIFFFGFLIQGAAEEVLFRGCFMNTIGGKISAVPAILISSVAFSLAHAANGGINLLAFFNIALFGVFAGLYMILFDDIWGACAIHSTWNFFQGNVYGISVSGTDVENSVFTLTNSKQNVILTGGSFGIEGSIFTTLILSLATALLIFILMKKGRIKK